MSPAEFDALAQLMRLRQSPSREALRLVLCEDKSPKDAEAITGTSWQNTYRLKASAKKVMESARLVAGAEPI